MKLGRAFEPDEMDFILSTVANELRKLLLDTGHENNGVGGDGTIGLTSRKLLSLCHG